MVPGALNKLCSAIKASSRGQRLAREPSINDCLVLAYDALVDAARRAAAAAAAETKAGAAAEEEEVEAEGEEAEEEGEEAEEGEEEEGEEAAAAVVEEAAAAVVEEEAAEEEGEEGWGEDDGEGEGTADSAGAAANKADELELLASTPTHTGDIAVLCLAYARGLHAALLRGPAKEAAELAIKSAMTLGQLNNARNYLLHQGRPLPPKLSAAHLCRYAALLLRNRNEVVTGDDVDTLDKSLGHIGVKRVLATGRTLKPLSDALRARIAAEACALARQLVVDVGTQDRFVQTIDRYHARGQIDGQLGVRGKRRWGL
jgi:hypothetical protein